MPKRFLMLIVLALEHTGTCTAISNTQFNASLRDYAVTEVTEDTNSSDVKTLQKELYERYAHLAPVSNTVRFKEVPDSALSPSSAHGRGLLHLNHHGYGLLDHEETPHYGYEYHFPDDHHGHYDDHHDHHDHHDHYDEHDHHGHEHYGHHHLVHHDDYKHGYGHHYKHYDHALAAKTVLWPIAGIALLGAAAALVSNPVLLQLGVVSGRRRRRDTEETNIKQEIFTKKGLEDEFIIHNLNHFHKNNDTTSNSKVNNNRPSSTKKGMLLNKAKNNSHRLLFRNVNPTGKTAIQKAFNQMENNKDFIDKHYIPIPLMMKDDDSN
ncbi:uncharacterized protein LOC135078354 [Ostrinia nubilalis]|uniref:uncharacterized protein LOC135078354 n=1 Tax=Ostrinia nubilalis TaxID=29057 RepID=UPI00308262FD